MNNKVPAFLKAAARQVVNFAGKHGSKHREPIVVLIGNQSREVIGDFQKQVLETLNVCNRLRPFASVAMLDAYLRRTSVRDPVYYDEDPRVLPSPQAQRYIAQLFRDDEQRHFAPLVLVAMRQSPVQLANVREVSSLLLPEFMELVGARIIDLTPEAMTGHIPSHVRMARVFAAIVARKSDIRVDKEALDLMEEALSKDVTTSDEVVMRIAAHAKDQARLRGLGTITRDFLWECLPVEFRQAIHPPEAVVH